jgi:phage gp37-like protein
MTATVGAIENAIIGRLQAASDAGMLGYRYAVLDTYPDDWKSYWSESPPQNFPAAWATFAGWRVIEAYGAIAKVQASFGVIVCAQSYRNQVAARQDATATEVGSYQLAQDAVGLLIGQTLGLDMAALEIGSCQFVGLSDQQRQAGLSMLALELSTTFEIGTSEFNPGLPDPADPAAIVFAVTWDIPPFVKNGGHVDAADDITLPQEES